MAMTHVLRRLSGNQAVEISRAIKESTQPISFPSFKVAIKYLQKGSLNCRQDEGELSE
jgi:hypothetical protein